ncbi:MAG: hypothetical protein HYZ53_21885 [Planctomycetes bacterium]|nr:hypothetical protein [Planctomycetota bacterium]
MTGRSRTPLALLLATAFAGLCVLAWALFVPAPPPASNPVPPRASEVAPPLPQAPGLARPPASSPPAAPAPATTSAPAASTNDARAALELARAYYVRHDWSGLASLHKKLADSGLAGRVAFLALVCDRPSADDLALLVHLLPFEALSEEDRASLSAVLRSSLNADMGVEARSAALRLLGRLAGTAAMPTLLEELAHGAAPSTRQAAALALAERPPAEVSAVLLPLARNPAAGLSGIYAAFALCQSCRRVGDEAGLVSLRELRPALESRLLAVHEPDLAQESLVTLAAIDGVDTDAVLLALLRERPDPTLRRRAAQLLGEGAQREAEEPLALQAQAESDPAVRAAIDEALRALRARMGDGR